MKVLLIAPFPPPYGGIANWSAMISEYMKHQNEALQVLNIAPKKRATEGRTLFDRVVGSGIDMLKQNRELKKRITHERPDVIHMTTSGSLAIIRDNMLLKTAKKHHVPTVYHIRFGKTRQMAESNSVIWKLFSRAMRLAKTVIAIDKNTYDAICQYVPEAKAVLIPNPVNTEKLPSDDCKKAERVVFLGWVVPVKGVGELVDAWNTVAKEYPHYELQIIGQAKPEYLDELKAAVKVSSIEFLGEMKHDQAMELVAGSEVLILPSYTEGFPNAVVEAMAMKTAVIGTSVGAIPEMLGENCGMVIKPRDTEAIVSALRTMLSDSALRKQFAENAKNKVTEQYELRTVYSKYRTLWNEIKDG